MCLDHYDEIYSFVSSWLKEQIALQKKPKALQKKIKVLRDPEKIQNLLESIFAHKVLRDPKKIQNLVDSIIAHVSCCDNPLEVALITGLCALGPQKAGPPPEHLYNELLHLVRKKFSTEELKKLSEEEQDKLSIEVQKIRVFEMVVAYGVGGWPLMKYRRRSNSWENPQWDRPYRLFKEEVKYWIYESFKWLNGNVKYFENEEISDRKKKLIVEQVLWMIIDGTCTCYTWEGRRVTPGQSKKREDRHDLEHKLASWAPAGTSLLNFIANAVKGPRNGHLPFGSGGFSTGILYDYLQRDVIRLWFGKVLHKYCPKHEKTYEGDWCPYCKEGHFDETVERLVTRRLIVIPISKYGPYNYDEKGWWRCKNLECKNYYRAYHNKCPLCGCVHPQRRSSVYVRQFGPTHYRIDPVSLDPEDKKSGEYVEWQLVKQAEIEAIAEESSQRFVFESADEPSLTCTVDVDIPEDNKTVELLLYVLQNYKLIAKKFAKALGKTDDKRTVELLLQALRDSAPGVREDFAKALDKLGREQAVIWLFEKLQDDKLIAEKVAKALGKIGDKRIVELTFESLAKTFNNQFKNQWIRFDFFPEETRRKALSGVALLHRTDRIGDVYEGRYYLRNFGVKSACSLNFRRIDAELLAGSDSKMIADSYRATDEINRRFWERWLEQRKARLFRHPAFKGVYKMLDAQK
jgi:hypothetical protein